jgi:subtilisin family serine protease/PKD repeat protein
MAGLALAILLLSLLPVMTAAQAPRATVDPNVWMVLEINGRAKVLVVLQDQADVEGARLLQTKEEKGQYVYERLTETAARTQPAVQAALDQMGVSYKSYWIRNMFQVEVTSPVQVNTLAGRPDVGAIEYVYPVYPDVVLTSSRPAPQPNTVEWNIDRVDADLVWAMGITGTGAVVADLDTGVQWDHPALINSYRGNLGGGNYDHNYNWWEGVGGSPVPYDTGSHGTHTMGTMVGDDGAGNQIGMAPGAKWIACPGIGSPLVGVFDCFQFFLAPTDLNGQNPRPDLAPDVINNSWSGGGSFRDAIHTLYLAGILFSKSAGNTGQQGCSTITNPGQWPEVMANAAYGPGDTIASFSSRGPVTVDRETVAKPDIANPGGSVRSSVPTNGYGVMSGTSMASPHGAGGVALLISAFPELSGQIDTIQYILKYSAEPKIDAQCTPFVDRPNDVWGWGIMNIKNAVDYAAGFTGFGWLNGQVTAATGGAPLPNARLDLTLDSTGWNFIPRYSDAAGNYSYTLLLATTYHITATQYGYLPGVAAVTVQDGLTTTQNMALQTAPQWTISGYVREEGSGNPLAATLTFEGTPVVAATDPATGYYSATIYQGVFWTIVQSPGHAQEIVKLPIVGNVTENFTLTAVYNYHLRESGAACGPTLNWVDARDGTRVCLGDDASATLNLGRSVPFYGSTYTFLYIGSNGFATFQLPASTAPTAIPDPAAPNNGMYAFATDLNPDTCNQGEIFWKWVGNVFVLEYYQVEHYPSGDPETFEIILDADTGLVSMQYLTVSNPAGIIVGVENDTGTEATQYMGTVTDGLALAYYPAFSTPPFQATGTMAGTVSDAGTSVPITGALVEAYNPSDVLFTATTDLSGTYSMDLCSDFYVAAASAAGYTTSAPTGVTVLDGETATADFALTPISSCEPPTATSVVWTPTVPMAGEMVTFTVTASGTPPIDYNWDLGDGMTGIGAIVQHTYITDGVYTVIVTATNDCGADDATNLVTVATPEIVPPPPPPPPGLNPGQQAYGSFTLVNTGTAGLEWSLAEVPDAPWLEEAPANGTIAPGSSAEVLLTYTAPITTGVYTTNVRVSSNDPVHPVVDVLVEMGVAEACTRVEITTVTPTINGCAVTLEAVLTGDPPFAYLWTFGDGMTSTAAMPSHTYTQTGTYSGTLVVDNCGGDGQALADFTVQVACAAQQYRVYLPLVFKGVAP